MRQPLFILAIIASLLLGANVATAQTLDEVITKYRAAKGGEARKSVDTMRMSARMVAQRIELAMTIMIKRPKMIREEMAYQGVSIVQAFDGTMAWRINPMVGSSEPIELNRPMAAALRDRADFDGALFDYRSKGSIAEVLGTEDLEGTKVVHVKLTTRNNQVQHYYLDAATMLEKKVVAQVDTGTGLMTIETLLSDYRTFSGIPVPMTIRQKTRTESATITVEKVEFNVPVDDAVFRMPRR